jgi:TetR/AcrR family transcriptional repressor of lmrAB and yxaGH operons
MPRRDVRTEMIRGAGDLLASRGLHGTSFALVLEATGAPRGSIYHHFPGGKRELVEEAIAAVGATVGALIDDLDADSPAAVVDAFVEGWRAVLLGSHYEQGCAVAAAGLDDDDADGIRDAARTVFDAWHASLTRALVRSGSPERDASDLALLCLAAVEGALILGRVTRSDKSFDALARQLKVLTLR